MGLKEVNKIFYEKDKKEDKIGDGSEGTVVFRGYIKDCIEERKVAVKRLLKEKYETGYKEVETLRHLESHENIIRYFRSGEEEDFLYIALELCQANLEGLVTGNFNPKKPLDHKEILFQIANGIQYLHRLKIVHRDLKPRNILVKEWDTGLCQIKVSDFGISKKIENGRNCFTQSTSWRGTLGWMAPEIINKKPGEKLEADLAVDSFSAGCIFYYICTGGDHPFGEEQHCHSNIAKGEYKLTDLPKALKDLIEKMIKFDPRLRLSSDQVLTHSYFRRNSSNDQFQRSDLPDEIYHGFAATGRFESPVKTDDEKVNSLIHNKSPGMNVLLNPDLGEFMSNNPEARELFKKNENLQNIIKEIRDNPALFKLYFKDPDLLKFIDVFSDTTKKNLPNWIQNKPGHFINDNMKKYSCMDPSLPCHDRNKWPDKLSPTLPVLKELQSQQPSIQQSSGQQPTSPQSSSQQPTSQQPTSHSQQPNSQQSNFQSTSQQSTNQEYINQESTNQQSTNQQPSSQYPNIGHLYISGGQPFFGCERIYDQPDKRYQNYQPYQNQTYNYKLHKVETLVLGSGAVNIIHHPANEDGSDDSDDDPACDDDDETYINSL